MESDWSGGVMIDGRSITLPGMDGGSEPWLGRDVSMDSADGLGRITG
jgi:hypothetical protein